MGIKNDLQKKEKIIHPRKRKKKSKKVKSGKSVDFFNMKILIFLLQNT